MSHKRSDEMSRRDCLKLGAATVAMLSQFKNMAKGATSGGDRKRRVLILGIDGMSPHLLRQYVAEGKMPHFAELMRDGDFKPLRSSNPPQSPVAWSNFITGMNPGVHGIYDFIHRDPATMTPMLSTSRTLPPSKVLSAGNWEFPLWGGGAELLRKGPAFWTRLAEHGVPATLYRLPANFPPVESDARTLSGLGTPDLLGAYGVPSYITDRKPENADDYGDINLAVVDMSKHQCKADLVGPENAIRKGAGELRVPLKVYRDPINDVLRVDLQGQQVLLNEGEWSDWVTVQFDMLPHLASIKGICRFYAKQVHPHFELYVSPMNIDPSSPGLPISTPASFSTDLADALGPFYTQGIAEDTKALSTGLFNDADYLKQAMLVLEEQCSAFDHLLNNFNRGLLFFYFSSIDVNSHMFWRTMDPHHPLYSKELDKQFGKTIENLYIRMDAILGKALEKTDKNTTLMVLSDHGFRPFYRTFGVNSWLADNRYATMVDPGARGEGKIFSNTDWQKTYAYGLGINGLYLNLKGRERDGVISPGKNADMMLDRIAEELRETKDPETGSRVFKRVYKAKEVYSGDSLGNAPDLILGFNHGYRASWKTILGTYDKETLADNMDPWSGDHCMDVDGLSGVLLCNRKITSDKPALIDLAPTILAEYGISPVDGTEGKVILEPPA